MYKQIPDRSDSSIVSCCADTKLYLVAIGLDLLHTLETHLVGLLHTQAK